MWRNQTQEWWEPNINKPICATTIKNLISLAVNEIIRIYRPNNWEVFYFVANKKNLLWKRRAKLIFVHSVEIEWERIQIQKNRNTLNLLIFKWFTRVWKWFWGVRANEKWNDWCICIIKYPVKCICMTISQTAHRPNTHWANRKQNVIHNIVELVHFTFTFFSVQQAIIPLYWRKSMLQNIYVFFRLVKSLHRIRV